MAVRTIECSACGTAVPYGRLSCPECGELLASVAGAARRLTSVAVVAAPSSVDVAPASTLAAVAASDGPAETLEDEAPIDEDAPLGAATDVSPVGEPAVATAPVDRPIPSVLHDVAPAAEAAADDDDLGTLVDEPRWPPARSPSADQPVATQRPLDAPRATDAPGAYVPPSPAAIAAASAWPGDAAVERTPTSLADAPPVPAPARAWQRLTAPPTPVDAETAAARDPLPLTDPARRAEAVGWLAVAGATIAAVGFLLPWSDSIPGADGIGYFDRWGFALAGGLVVVVGLLAVLAGALVRNPIPAWVRQGLPGIILGALLLGLAWPYLFTILGAQIGALLSVVGALILLVAGIATMALDRHVPVQPPV